MKRLAAQVLSLKAAKGDFRGFVVREARHILFQLAEVAVLRELFAQVPERDNRLWPVPV